MCVHLEFVYAQYIYILKPTLIFVFELDCCLYWMLAMKVSHL